MAVDQGAQLPDITEDTISSADCAVALLVWGGSETSHEGLFGLTARHCRGGDGSGKCSRLDVAWYFGWLYASS